MFKPVKLGRHCTGPPSNTHIFKLVHGVAHTVGKRAVGIPLKYSLVLYVLMLFGDQLHWIPFTMSSFTTNLKLRANFVIRRKNTSD